MQTISKIVVDWTNLEFDHSWYLLHLGHRFRQSLSKALLQAGLGVDDALDIAERFVLQAEEDFCDGGEDDGLSPAEWLERFVAWHLSDFVNEIVEEKAKRRSSTLKGRHND
jgi:hypothetical protein